MACKKKMETKNNIRPKGQWSDHNYMLHTPHMTRVGNIVVLPIITF
jgi:hypothetical protein